MIVVVLFIYIPVIYTIFEYLITEKNESVDEIIIKSPKISEEQLLIFDCLTAAFILHNNKGNQTALERRGFEDLVLRLKQRKHALPESLQMQVSLYLQKKKLGRDETCTAQENTLKINPDILFDKLKNCDIFENNLKSIRNKNDLQYVFEQMLDRIAFNKDKIDQLLTETKQKDNRIFELEQEVLAARKLNNTLLPPLSSLAPPPPPPPPPPPAPIPNQRSESTPIIKNRHRYLHPFSLKNRYPTLDSISEQPNTKQFFWSKLTCTENTIWDELKKTSDDVIIDKNELQTLFKKNKQTITNKPVVTTLLEFNRANHIAIMLAKIKLPHAHIRDAIWKIDDSILTTENLIAIQQFIPTNEEVNILKHNKNHLGKSENYFRSIMIIPKLSDRLDCMIYRRRFQHEVKELKAGLDTLHLAITELRQSHRFKIVLKTILAIGNHLNGQSVRGNACGFHLNSLLKLRDTKTEGKGGVPTLLHYIVHYLSKYNIDVLNFKQDILHLQAAAKLSPSNLFTSVDALNSGLQQIKKALISSTTEYSIDRFSTVMKEFILEAEPIVENLNLNIADIKEKLKNIVLYFGEDPQRIKSEEFFDIISTFSNLFEKARIELHESKDRLNRRQNEQLKGLKQQYQPMVSYNDVLKELRAGLKQIDKAWQIPITTNKNSTEKLVI